jgi:hypothetical protein
VLTGNEYMVIEPTGKGDRRTEEQPPCCSRTVAITVEGPGKRGEIIQVRGNSECDVHRSKPSDRVEEESECP